ncbi:MAG: glycosyltransferase family 2 protein [Lachnospiraceae bacterium]|nr:glycosyltransferase family 2 protein [Lachnospiraceae bacterium]
MKLSVIIPNYNGAQYLDQCLKSLMRQEEKDFEIIVVDDASTDGSAQKAMESFPCVKWIFHEENRGFAASVNDGIAAAEADHVLLLNNDTVAERHFVGELYRAVTKSEDIFSASAAMLKMDKPSELDGAGDCFSSLGWAFSPGRDKPEREYRKGREIFSACGGAAIYRKDLLMGLGAFDEEHFAYLEDVDLGFRAKWAGFRNVYAPRARVLHAGSGSSGSRYNPFKLRLTVRNQIYLLYKNLPLWMLVCNLSHLWLGWLVKLLFFTLKGMGADYLRATAEGLALCGKKRQKRLDFALIPFGRQLRMEAELLLGTIHRFM